MFFQGQILDSTSDLAAWPDLISSHKACGRLNHRALALMFSVLFIRLFGELCAEIRNESHSNS
jgi:hypothetical protein